MSVETKANERTGARRHISLDEHPLVEALDELCESHKLDTNPLKGVMVPRNLDGVLWRCAEGLRALLAVERHLPASGPEVSFALPGDWFLDTLERTAALAVIARGPYLGTHHCFKIRLEVAARASRLTGVARERADLLTQLLDLLYSFEWVSLDDGRVTTIPGPHHWVPGRFRDFNRSAVFSPELDAQLRDVADSLDSMIQGKPADMLGLGPEPGSSRAESKPPPMRSIESAAVETQDKLIRRRQGVGLALTIGVRQAAKKLTVSPSTISRWCKAEGVSVTRDPPSAQTDAGED
jgi:hypothetical protein